MKKIITFLISILILSCSSVKKKKYDSETIRIFRGEKCVRTLPLKNLVYTLQMANLMIMIRDAELSGRIRVYQSIDSNTVFRVVWYDEKFREVHDLFLHIQVDTKDNNKTQQGKLLLLEE